MANKRCPTTRLEGSSKKQRLESKKTKASSSNEAPSPPASLAVNGISKESWEALEASQDNIPRFLFRAFGEKSGGDSRLNTRGAIIPRGFLGGKKPTNIYEIRHLRHMVEGHYIGRHVKTEFSSWAACITAARGCASHTKYIAIIDRTLLAPHVKIYHIPDLDKHVIRREADRGSHEYLAYGPISGPALHCVAYRDIENREFYSLSGRSYGTPYSLLKPEIFLNVEKRVIAAKNLASLFRPSHDQRPDIIIALTAAFSSLCYCGPYKGSSRKPDKNILTQLLIHLHDELKVVKLPSKSSKKLGLVNSRMYTREFPQLRQLVALLKSIEDGIRNDKRNKRKVARKT
ncbi:hypothetical protein F4806DRAFT_493354 [Annulohypoxylon nitens]|nr:hypothetical protein F4806DRAFT_493354 [Annulohypoxylon nitens]